MNVVNEVFVLKAKSKNEGLKEMQSLAISKFSIPGEAQFPLNAMYSKPANRPEEGLYVRKDAYQDCYMRTLSLKFFISWCSVESWECL